jgi:hypothetical protein
VGATDVLWIDPSHPRDHALDVVWRVDHRVVGHAASLDLGEVPLRAGTHEAEATVSDPRRPAAAPVTKTWTVDDSTASTDYEVSDPISVSRERDGTPHYTVRESFTLALAAKDDQPGSLVSEFRVDGDGWFHYFGWPTDGSKPFLFTPTGTDVDALVYGNLGTGGLSGSPFAERLPGYGTHQIEYRSTDAAGNIAPAKKFTVTVLPSTDPAPGAVPVEASAVTTCVKDQTQIRISARNTSQHRADLVVRTPYGKRNFRQVGPGKTASAVFRTGEPTTETGSATVSAHTTVRGHGGARARSLDATYDVPYNRFACS